MCGVRKCKIRKSASNTKSIDSVSPYKDDPWILKQLTVVFLEESSLNMKVTEAIDIGFPTAARAGRRWQACVVLSPILLGQMSAKTCNDWNCLEPFCLVGHGQDGVACLKQTYVILCAFVGTMQACNGLATVCVCVAWFRFHSVFVFVCLCVWLTAWLMF